MADADPTHPNYPGTEEVLHHQWKPPADVAETNDVYQIQLELPGVAKEDVNVEQDDNRLEVYGTRNERFKEDYRIAHQECEYGRFRRSFDLPTNVKVDGISASFENGILMITLPKVQRSKSHTVDIS